MKHIFEKHTNCQKEHCNICDGGLSVCTVCKGAEGDLTTECCGHFVSDIFRQQVYNGKIDFIDGKWVKK